MKKLFITISFVLIGVFSAIAQTNEPVYEQVDIMPEYKGGTNEMVNFIGKNLKYPEQAVKANVIGKVIVKIIIEKDGSVNSVSLGLC
jgi:protein TonB